jgi:hypothetical protein
MGKLGKLCVFLNLALSLSLMIWAMSLYVHRIDWSDNKANEKEGLPEGQYATRLKKVQASWRPMPDSEEEWRKARKNLLQLEEQRRATRRWYDAEMAKLEKDPNPKQPTQLRGMKPDLNGQPDLDAGPEDPKFPKAARIKTEGVNGWGIPATPLHARNVYDDQETAIFTQNDEATVSLYRGRTKLREGIENNVGYITSMLGPRGLHARLQDEKAKRSALTEEYKTTLPMLINTATSSHFAVEREKELRARVEELEEERDRLRRKLGIAEEQAP